MQTLTVLDVVHKCIGPTEPVGSSHIDADRLENLKSLIELMKELHIHVDSIASYKDKTEHSVKVVGECADKYLDWLGIPKE